MSVNVRVTAVNKKRLDSLGTAELLLPSGCGAEPERERKCKLTLGG